ncbi:hypothetical protein B0I37DRAFT_386696 [Chaetomium sp. MPI-CAGE-AT-0009]|nr:hypothetical protein B0I37DRAFT_386696 [Chaetomium sp. MPI-CAGE-AT-0009]
MKNVRCECGKAFKTNNSMNQHKRDSPRHQQHAETGAGNSEPAQPGISSPTRGGGLPGQAPNNPPTASSVWYSSRYPLIEFVREGESAGASRTKAEKNGPRKRTGEVGSESARRRYLLRARRSTSYEYGAVQDMPQNSLDWSLCDKDCGWCGRCGRGML